MSHAVLIVAVTALVTIAVRFLPFAVFGKRPLPRVVVYLGRVLPPAIMAALEPSQKRLKLLLPYTAAGLLAEIRQEGKVFSEEYTPDGILADALVHIRVLHKVAPYQIS